MLYRVQKNLQHVGIEDEMSSGYLNNNYFHQNVVSYHLLLKAIEFLIFHHRLRFVSSKIVF